MGKRRRDELISRSFADSVLIEAFARKALLPPVERKRLRVQAGLSLKSCAGALGVSTQAVAHWEKGAEAGGREPRGHNLIRCRAVERTL